jgi:nitrate reductase alpha subunit
MIHVKDGIVTWEMQGLDYPSLENGLPPYEPRGCQRGISFSWYLYSPLRVKYPYIRGALLDLWRAARMECEDPVDAWKSLVTNPVARARWQRARGKGGFRRTTWDEVLEIMAAANIHTIKQHGPDRIAGFSPIPAMSMVSYASGARLMQLMGGISLSFYDWYCDLPSASPETWGEQTDVQESADWYNAKLLAVMGSNLNMTRTPDCHFAAEARHNGTKMYVFSPDFNQVAKYADHWVSVNAGQDGAWWMAMNHVLLKEFHHERQVPYFIDYTKRYTDAPYLVELNDANGVFEAGQLLRANRLKRYEGVENGEWKFLMWDTASNAPRMPMGSSGFRWGTEKGKWNLLLKDGLDGSDIDPTLTFLGDSVASVRFDDFADGRSLTREVPVRTVKAADGSTITVATVYDILMAQYGVARGLQGDYPADYDDESVPYTPAWAEKFTGMGRKDLLQFAREWGSTAEHTNGKCTIIIGAGINHWYHANLMYRAGIHALMFCGCVGVNGGGLHTMSVRRSSHPENRGEPLRSQRIGIPLHANRTRRAGIMSTPTSGGTRKTSPTTTPSRRISEADRSPGDTRWMSRCEPSAMAGFRSTRSSRPTASSWRTKRKPRERRRTRRSSSTLSISSPRVRSSSRSKTRTLRRTGPACGTSGAATH